MRIEHIGCTYEREPLRAPFGFKGNALTTLWQTSVLLRSGAEYSVGLGVQSVLWSDAEIFADYGEEKGNALMFAITQHALKRVAGFSFETPLDLFEYLFPLALAYGKEITGREDLRPTFALNALVPIDLAAWLLYARVNKITSFDRMIPGGEAWGSRQEMLANIPLIPYGCGLDTVKQMAEDGVCLFKIKIGSDPDRDGDLDKMAAWDKNRLDQLHTVLKDYRTPYTESGTVQYYLDANGRYDSKERVKDFLNYASQIGALDRILLFEEPFDEENKVPVHDIGVPVAADESVHGLDDVKERIALGYRAITLKPIAKTLSLTIRILEYARRAKVSCFCADLTVNPVMVDWNKNVAARINRIDGMKIGVVESNGEQNYTNWEKMLSYHPMFGAEFTKCKNGIYRLDESFYTESGGVFQTPAHYFNLFGEKS